MAKIKEGFKGERFISLPENLLEEYSKDPLIGNLYLRKIGYFPQVKYHYIQKDQGCNYSMLIYCTDGEGWYQIHGEKHLLKKDEYIILPLTPLILSGLTTKILGQSIGYTSTESTAASISTIITCRTALRPTTIPAYKTVCNCLRKSTTVSPLRIFRNTCATRLPACIFSSPLLYFWNNTVPYSHLSIKTCHFQEKSSTTCKRTYRKTSHWNNWQVTSSIRPHIFPCCFKKKPVHLPSVIS